MLFNSYEFIFVFLPITFFVYFFLISQQFVVQARLFLVLASLFFYSWWNVIYLPVILGSIVFNFYVAKMMMGQKSFLKKYILFFGIGCNLILLAYFKYVDFLIENVNDLFGQNFDLFHIMLPLAISFFTFQQISYLVDSFKGTVKEHHFLNYSIFVSFFPQLIAGPIVHHKEMMPQFNNPKNSKINFDNIAVGLFIFSLGLFKKVVIADTFAFWATNGFSHANDLQFMMAWVTSLSFTFQLYFDFSGYSDMAIGLALLFNIKLPINFNSPYKAYTIQDFWRRWHITLSIFLRDYIYIPLGGSHLGDFKTYNNLLVTFLIGGLWHGAGWTFLFWGFLHGAALIVYRLWKKEKRSMPIVLAWLITFNFINMTWVFFRAEQWDDAISVLAGMFGLNGLGSSGLQNQGNIVIYLLLALALVLFSKNTVELMRNFRQNRITVMVSAGAFVWAILSLNSISEFLYFNF